MIISREVVINSYGSPVWRICSNDICVECPSGTQAAAIIQAIETAHGITSSTPKPLQPPRIGPDIIPDPGV